MAITGASTAAALRYRSTAGRWVITATVLGSGIAALDANVVGIALPSIGKDFGVGVASLQWVVTGYSLTLSGLLLIGGAMGDRYGRRRLFIIGTVWFALASLLCGVAPSAEVLIGARALQGVGGALLTPGSLSILQATFAPEDRSRAIGAWSGLGGVATAIGPFVGGWLISAASWRLVFFINLPLSAAVIYIASRHVPESRDLTITGSLDVPGAASATLGLVGLTYGLIEGPSQGWFSPVVLAALTGGVVLLVSFVWIEMHRRHPMLPPSLFASRQFSAANAVTFVVYGGLGGALFLLPIELQQVAGYSPLASGIALLPVTFLMLILSARSGALAARIGPRLQMSVGPIVVGFGLALMARITASGDYVTEVLPAVVVLGLGLAITVAPLTSTVLSAAPSHNAGVASAVNNGVARAAGLMAVAVLPAAAGLGGTSYLHPAAFEHGFRIAIIIAAAASVLGGLLAVWGIRNPAAPRPPQPGETSCPLEAPPLRADRGTMTR